MTAPKDKAPAGWEGGVELQNGERGWLCSGPTAEPVRDWDGLMELWGLDPREFEVVGDATFKAWNGYMKGSDNEPVIIKLYSYKARVQRKTAIEPEVDWVGWRKSLQSGRTSRIVAVPLRSIRPTVSYVVCVADPQLGKPGTLEAIDNWRRGIEAHAQRITMLRERYNIERVVLAFMGDEHEGVANNYGNQPHTTVLNLSKQLETDFDLRVWSVRELLRVGLTDVLSVISNHGEFTRNGSKDPVTTGGDNSSTMITRMVRRLFDEVALDRSDISLRWHVADENPDIVLELSGVKNYFAHGHVAQGGGKDEKRLRTAIQRQILGRTTELHGVALYTVAHYHHAYIVEDQGRTILGCPALEAEHSSDFMERKYGVWSRPGMLGYLVGSDLGPRGYAELGVTS